MTTIRYVSVEDLLNRFEELQAEFRDMDDQEKKDTHVENTMIRTFVGQSRNPRDNPLTSEARIEPFVFHPAPDAVLPCFNMTHEDPGGIVAPPGFNRDIPALYNSVKTELAGSIPECGKEAWDQTCKTVQCHQDGLVGSNPSFAIINMPNEAMCGDSNVERAVDRVNDRLATVACAATDPFS